VLRGIDATFDRYDRQPKKTKKINGLGYCVQEVLAAAEEMQEAAVGSRRQPAGTAPGLEHGEIARFFLANAQKLRQASSTPAVMLVAEECAVTLTALASALGTTPVQLEDLERRLTVMEEKLLAALTMSTTEDELFAIRTEADREISPYRSKMPGAQIVQLQKQFIHKRLFEKAKIPRLSLFYL